MEVPYTITGEHPPMISVWLSNKRGNVLKDFHCVVCGRIAFQYYSDVRIIMPGEPPESAQAPIVVQCQGVLTAFQHNFMKHNRCKSRYYVA